MSDEESDNPYLRRLAQQGKQSKGYHRAPKQEKQLAARFGGHPTPQSGAGWRKGDVRAKGSSRIEAKCTQAKSFSVTREMVQKIESAAIGNDEIPFIVIEFLDAGGKPDMEVAVLPVWALKQLLAKE